MVVLETQYFPCIAYFCSFFYQEQVFLEAHENYGKQTYRNRCRIRTANKVESLSVPVKSGNSRTAIRDLKIDHSEHWVKIHWRALQSAYGRAPYFEFYADYIRDIFEKKHVYLFDLNIDSLTLCLKFLQMDVAPILTEKYEKQYNPPFKDLRTVISPKKENSTYDFYREVAYPQIFGKDFVANLSVLDLLFCEGPNARTVIKNSVLPL